MFVCRLVLSLSLVFALAVICPIRCQAEAARAFGGTAVEAEGCPCCSGEGEQGGTPAAPVGDDCADCVCDGAVDGPRVEAVELSTAMPEELSLATDCSARGATCEIDVVDGRPDAPDGAKLRLLMASLVI